MPKLDVEYGSFGRSSVRRPMNRWAVQSAQARLIIEAGDDEFLPRLRISFTRPHDVFDFIALLVVR